MNGIDESRGMKPLLSVVIPVHNIKLYLERCVASLAAQTIADRMEVIMVENGSFPTGRWPNAAVLPGYILS